MSILGKDEKDPEKVQVAGRALTCLVCGGEQFWKRKAQLNTRLLTFLDIEWANPNATLYVCDSCGHIHWFLPRDDKTQI